MEEKEPRPMKEIHEIRLRLYEEDRGLSPEERIKKTNEIAQRTLKKLGIEDNLIYRIVATKI